MGFRGLGVLGVDGNVHVRMHGRMRMHGQLAKSEACSRVAAFACSRLGHLHAEQVGRMHAAGWGHGNAIARDMWSGAAVVI